MSLHLPSSINVRQVRQTAARRGNMAPHIPRTKFLVFILHSTQMTGPQQPADSGPQPPLGDDGLLSEQSSSFSLEVKTVAGNDPSQQEKGSRGRGFHRQTLSDYQRVLALLTHPSAALGYAGSNHQESTKADGEWGLSMFFLIHNWDLIKFLQVYQTSKTYPALWLVDGLTLLLRVMMDQLLLHIILEEREENICAWATILNRKF